MGKNNQKLCHNRLAIYLFSWEKGENSLHLKLYKNSNKNLNTVIFHFSSNRKAQNSAHSFQFITPGRELHPESMKNLNFNV